MNSDYAITEETGLSSAADRLLLRLTLLTGYAFLGFFGWLLTL
jgi:hypothetical protein